MVMFNTDNISPCNGHLFTNCDMVNPYGNIGLAVVGSGNGLLPDGIKPLPEPMLTSH